MCTRARRANMKFFTKMIKKLEGNPFEKANSVKVELFENEEALELIRSMEEGKIRFIRMKDCTFSSRTLADLREQGYTAENINYQGRPGILLKW